MEKKKKNTKRIDKPKTRYTFMRLKEITHATGLSATYIYNMVREGKFPPPIDIIGTITAWRSDEIQAWMDERCQSSINLEV
ncbi:MAG: helix-turn-helix transcriptional regulator [Bradymonadia bacterium]